MIRDIDLSVFVRLGDQLTAPLRDVEGTIARASERMNRQLALSMKLAGGGAAAGVIAEGARRMVTGFTDSIRDVERAKGELATLGVQDLDLVVRRGREMQNELAGVTADAFVRAAYDIRSGISSLTDQGVADMTAAAMVTAKATRGVPEQMTSLFATSYGIFKDQYAIMSDADFGNMFGAALSASVQQFKTDGAAMQQAIESAGSGAVNLGMQMTEQLALLGMMQQTMQAGEAGTALRAFATNAARAHEAFGDMAISADRPVRVRVLDENGALREMPDILADLQARYGETLDAFEAAEIKEAFGTDEAMKMINALYGQEAAVRANSEALDEAAGRGAEFTEEMARAADNNWDAAMVLMSQRMNVLQQMIGERLLPVVQRLTPYIDAFITSAFNWIDANPELVTGIGAVVVGLGTLAAIIAPLLLGASALVSGWAMMSYGAVRLGLGVFKLGKWVAGAGKWLLWLGRAVLPMVGKAILWIGRALIANPIGAIIMGIAGAAYLIYQYWEPISAFFQNLWGQVVSAFNAAIDWIGGAVSGIVGFDWSSLLTLDGLRNAWAGIRGFLGSVLGTLWDALSPLSWLGIVKSEDLAGAWAGVTSFVSGTASKVWDGITSIEWSSYIPAFSWDGIVAVFAWENVLTALDWATWLLPIRWLEFIPGFEWSSVIDGVLDWADWLNPFSWGQWVSEKLSLGDWVEGFEWTDIIAALDIRNWLSFSWSDVLPDWDWGAIIPDLPDLKAMFTDAGEALDVRLENRATTTFGQWDEGIEMVEQYRQGLLDIETMQDQLAAKVATEEGAWNWSYDVERAAEMLELLREIESARSSSPTDIANPETLLQAAQAANELETRFPAITAAANEVLIAVQAILADMSAAIKTVDMTSEGARIAQSIANGLTSQIGAVSAAANQIAATIRNALPGNARVNVALGASAPAIQARASGGSFRPGWLLTGEQGPELEYRTEGGFIAHNRALRGMLDMASRTRDVIQGINVGGAGPSHVPALASVAAAGGAAMQRGPISLSPQYNMPLSFAPGVDVEEVRATVRAELMDAEERAMAAMRGLLHD